MTVIDWDNAQRSWYIIDLGTEVWEANQELFNAGDDTRLEKIAQMKEWILESYGWDTTEAELVQGCQWRRDFMHYLEEGALSYMKPTDEGYF